MDIAPPFGYQDVVALQRNAKVRLPQPGEVPAFARAYLHLVSLENFARLLERRAARGATK